MRDTKKRVDSSDTGTKENQRRRGRMRFITIRVLSWNQEKGRVRHVSETRYRRYAYVYYYRENSRGPNSRSTEDL